LAPVRDRAPEQLLGRPLSDEGEHARRETLHLPHHFCSVEVGAGQAGVGARRELRRVREPDAVPRQVAELARLQQARRHPGLVQHPPEAVAGARIGSAAAGRFVSGRRAAKDNPQIRREQVREDVLDARTVRSGAY
jgi:hypothetical protein